MGHLLELMLLLLRRVVKVRHHPVAGGRGGGQWNEFRSWRGKSRRSRKRERA